MEKLDFLTKEEKNSLLWILEAISDSIAINLPIHPYNIDEKEKDNLVSIYYKFKNIL
jgi:hypothetical protein